MLATRGKWSCAQYEQTLRVERKHFSGITNPASHFRPLRSVFLILQAYSEFQEPIIEALVAFDDLLASLVQETDAFRGGRLGYPGQAF